MQIYHTSEEIEHGEKLIAFRAKEDGSKERVLLQHAHRKIFPDLFGMAFWLMGRIEEYGNQVPKDSLGRFSAKNSFAYKEGFILRPIVDEWTYWLRSRISKKFPNFSLVKTKFCVDISHDVDVPFLFLNQNLMKLGRRMAGDLITRKSIKMFLSRPRQFIFTKFFGVQFDPCFNFDYLMQVAEEIEQRATFYFIAENFGKPINGDYNIFQDEIINLLKNINMRGHKIGLHPSYHSSLDDEIIGKELSRFKKALSVANFEQAMIGSRQHFLRFDFFKTPKILHKCGLRYDSTLAFADHIGFRAGTSIPYRYFDFSCEKEINFQIRPLVLMDVSLIAPWYMNLHSLEKAQETLSMIRDNLRRVDGCYSILWHNNQLDTKEKKDIFECIIRSQRL